MASAFYERLSAQDASFLAYETRNTHMHITWTWIFDSTGLQTVEGGIDIERIRNYIASRLHWIPRYRQRIEYIPVENDPIWVDDDRFNLNYHVRHTALPQPGDANQLKQLTSRVNSQQLDRRRPLWELWVVEGLDGGKQFAIISKTHHCMVDGVSTVDLMSVLLSRVPKDTVDDAPRWIPRPAPSAFDLLRDALQHRLHTGMELIAGVGAFVEELRDAATDLDYGIANLWRNISTGLSRAPRTPLNLAPGPHRRVDWMSMSLQEIKEIKNQLGGTVNDTVLAIVAGAVRSFLKYRNVDTNEFDFRVVVPVSVRSPEQRGQLGNRASAWVLSLPIHIADPAQRLGKIREQTQGLKENKQALGADLMLQVADWAGSNLMALGVGVMNRLLRPYNLVVTNIPGSQEPFYLLQSQMLEAFPQVPLFANQCLGIALSSYLGQMHWGFNADWDQVPDLDQFTHDVEESFRDLLAAARATKPKKPRPLRPRRRPARGSESSAPSPA